MCCKSWSLWLGLLGLCVAGAILRCPDHVRAQQSPPRPTEVKQAPAPPDDGKMLPANPGDGKQAPANATPNVVIVGNGRRGPVQPQVKPPPTVVFEKTVEGHGITDEDAIQVAIDYACDEVADFLASKYGETYKPTPEQLKRKQIVGTPEFRIVTELTVTGDAAQSPMHQAKVPLKINSDQLKEFREEAREQRVGVRTKTAGVALAGLLALILVGGGYLRLEEATKGYYTTLLRVGAGAVLVVIGLMLFRLWH